jgi:hypothetical protein
MHNQHARLSQLLAEQHRSERQEQAAQARLLRALARRVAVAQVGDPALVAAGPVSPPSGQPLTHPTSADRSGDNHVQLTRILERPA